ncbi:transcriptional repressor, CopY family [Pirellula staleyi DSM 6068]|uniref:Transcriptional repressor, CopY family n=1 Tax=Pirellula staleyi (strain ATCC 27377 / DSM 6068 / ICPB 4128) TaxID=530564 RepID=D2QZY4_PIRSD|nr:BlaI/MecI/CopY family transcriptional regulator [Pirellula staleyi]ADB18349.1 transcriptional repressor, CopY family [Pirellula staleyi DSM 6068]
MSQQRDSLGKVELEILQLIDKLQPVTVRTLVDHLAESSGQARTTILTVVERIRKKGFVSRRKIGGVFHYSPRIPVTQLLQRLVTDFVSNVLGGSVSPVVAYLQKTQQVDPAELAELRAIVEQLESQQHLSNKASPSSHCLDNSLHGESEKGAS